MFRFEDSHVPVLMHSGEKGVFSPLFAASSEVFSLLALGISPTLFPPPLRPCHNHLPPEKLLYYITRNEKHLPTNLSQSYY